MNKTGPRFQAKYIFLILIILCLLLIILSSLSSSVNNTMRNVVNTVLMPMQKGLNTVGGYVSNEVDSLNALQEVQEQNAQLMEELAYLRMENAKYELQDAELAKYRALLEMKDQYPDYETIGAHVIGENSTNWNRTILIDRGANDGIEVNMNVISQGGLVGIVTAVTANSSTVRTIIDQDCQVGAMSLLSQETCIVRGDIQLYEEGYLYLEKLNKSARIEDGYKIVTSNKSSVYLPGILIGYSTDISMDSNSLTKSGHLIPVVDFSTLDGVLVITELKETGEQQ